MKHWFAPYSNTDDLKDFILISSHYMAQVFSFFILISPFRFFVLESFLKSYSFGNMIYILSSQYTFIELHFKSLFASSWFLFMNHMIENTYHFYIFRSVICIRTTVWFLRKQFGLFRFLFLFLKTSPYYWWSLFRDNCTSISSLWLG